MKMKNRLTTLLNVLLFARQNSHDADNNQNRRATADRTAREEGIRGRKKPESVEYYRQSVDANPNDAGVCYDTGLACAERGNYREALSWFQKALTMNPNHAGAYYHMGLAYDDLRNYPEAISCYQKALEMNPDYAAAYTNMGNAYCNLGNKQEQLNYYKKAARLGEESAQRWLRDNAYSW
jgi:tetratricopeptide (TPR) repeat protein